MELDNIKTQTTWSDASASINKNFGKILRGIRDGIPTIETPVDDQMSDESENAVQNKVIKKYIDDEVVYLEGYAEQQTNDLAEDVKSNTQEYVKLKTINGKSLYGTGNIVIGGGEGGGGGDTEELEEVSAGALCELNSRVKAQYEATQHCVKKIDFESYVEKDSEQTQNSEVIVVSALIDLNKRVNELFDRLNRIESR